MKKQNIFSNLCRHGILFAIALVTFACSTPDPVEVEVTRIVTETVVEEVIEEIEVEVTRIVIEEVEGDGIADSMSNGEIRQVDTAIELVYVPAGEAHFGGEIPTYDPDPSMVAFRKPFEVVNVDAFWIDKTEVSNVQFAQFVEETGHVTLAEEEEFSFTWSGSQLMPVPSPDATWRLPDGKTSWEELPDHPVVNVTTADAAAFCEWRGARLPTDFEWEKAASWDQTTATALKFPWGNELDDSRANACDINCVDDGLQIADYDDRYARTAPVNSFAAGASPYGALNMVGNVFEFVQSDDPEVTIFRGGGWNQDTLDTEVKARQAPPFAVLRSDEIGFRCAQDAAPMEVNAPTEEVIEAVSEVEIHTPNFIATTSAIAEEKGYATTFPFRNDAVVNSIIGWFYNNDSTFIVNEDGTWGIYRGWITDNPETQYDGGTYELNDNTVVFTTDESLGFSTDGYPIGCQNQPGTYEIQWQESGAYRMVPIEDSCVPRRSYYEQLTNEDNLHRPLSASLLKIPMVDDAIGMTHLMRNHNFIMYSIETPPVFYADQAITLWHVVFNEPMQCEAGPFQCGLADIGSNRAAKGDILLAENGSIVIGESGNVATSGRLYVGDLEGSALPMFAGGCPPGFDGCGEPVGLTDVDGALIYLALQSHGPALEGEALDEQIGNIYGGCDRVLGSGVMGFAVDFAENPDDPGECAFLMFAQHGPIGSVIPIANTKDE